MPITWGTPLILDIGFARILDDGGDLLDFDLVIWNGN
jgi:hypothetical protein